MNYIKQIQLENKYLRQCIDEITEYINSSKFAIYPMVNKNDINLRITEWNRKILEIPEVVESCLQHTD
jgi:hypothetical protein